jgi:hypothetical protein
MIGTTHLFRQRSDEPFLDLHLFQCTCITVIDVRKRIPNCTVNICNMFITVNRKNILFGQIKSEFRLNKLLLYRCL